jgi:ribulose-phosphate 3-epimerase
VLIMTVSPGFGGQSFIEACLPKIERLAETIEKRKLPVTIEVDGGITVATAPLAVGAGASVLVAGTAVFGQKDYAKAIQDLRLAAEQAR